MNNYALIVIVTWPFIIALLYIIYPKAKYLPNI